MKPLFPDLDMANPYHALTAGVMGGIGLVIGLTFGSWLTHHITIGITVSVVIVIAFIVWYFGSPYITRACEEAIKKKGI